MLPGVGTIKYCTSCTSNCSSCTDSIITSNSYVYTDSGKCVASCTGKYTNETTKQCVTACESGYSLSTLVCQANCSSTNNTYVVGDNGTKICKSCIKYNTDNECVDNCKDAGLYYNESTDPATCQSGCEYYID